MKILHVVRQFEPSVGGLETYVKTLCQHQQAQGHSCEVLTLNKVFHGQHGTLAKEDRVNDIAVRRVGFIGMRRFFLPRIAPSYFRRFDIVHVHNTDVFFDYVAAIKPWIRAPIFATTHGSFFHTPDLGRIKKIYFKFLTTRSARAYDCIFAISQNDQQLFLGTGAKIRLQPNAIAPIGNFTCNGPDLLYLGRLSQNKKVDRLIETFAQLKQRYGFPGLLHIVGPSWDVSAEALTQKARDCGVEDAVRLHGFASPEDLRRIAASCGFFVSASEYEGFGMSMLEAMSVGLVPLVQPNESFRELVTEAKIGHLIDYSDPSPAASMMADAMRAQTGPARQAAKEFAAKFSWEKLADDVLQIYREHLNVNGLNGIGVASPR